MLVYVDGLNTVKRTNFLAKTPEVRHWNRTLGTILPWPKMKEFLLTGNLGDIGVGMPIADALSLLGRPERTGKGLRGWTIESYAGGCFQLGHYEGVLGLIGIYFASERIEPPELPRATKCVVPFSASTSVEQFKAYLDANQIPWMPDLRLEDATALKVCTSVYASFDDDRLCSVLVSSK